MRAERSQWWRDFKATLKCGRCGENHPACLDFHHRDPKTKRLSLAAAADLGLAKERIMAEVAKCDVLCANCHRKQQWDEKSGTFARKMPRGHPVVGASKRAIAYASRRTY